MDSCNCLIGSKEFDCSELESVALSDVNVTRFKVCQGCLDLCDPETDYKEVKQIISSYLWFNAAESNFKEAKGILKDLKVTIE